jgi:hypothetical protein
MRKLTDAAQDVIAYRNAILSYTPTDHFTGVQHSSALRSARPEEETPIEPPGSPTEATDTVPTYLLEQLPSAAPPIEAQDLPKDERLLAIMQRQAVERQVMASEFRREQTQILNGYYDARVRENSQQNDQVDHRPLTEALRHISKRALYPADQGLGRFYKYAFRCEKLGKKFSKSLEKLSTSHELRSEMLWQKQVQDLVAYGDICSVDVSEIRTPKLPVPSAPEQPNV